MSEKLVKGWTELGTLNTNTNPTLQDALGARELLGIADIAGEGKLKLQYGYEKILSAPMLADYTTGTVSVSNGSKVVTGTSTTWLYGDNAELLADGVFAAGTGWTAAAGWTIGSGVATRAVAGTPFTLTNAVGTTSGLRYLLVYTITRTAGTVTVTCGGYSRAHAAAGTFTHTFIASSTAALIFTAAADFGGTVDNVSLKVLTPLVFRGDLFIGPDGEYYEVADIASDTSLTLSTEYAGVTASAQAYTVRHKVWMLAPFRSQVSGGLVSRTQSYVSTTDGTFTGTQSNRYGTSITPEVLISNAATDGSGYIANLNNIYAGYPTVYAQAFTPSSSVTAVEGVLIYWEYNDEYTNTVTVSIRSDSGGNPGSAVATTNSISLNTQNSITNDSKYWFAFTSPVNLDAGTTYFLDVRIGTNTYANILTSSSSLVTTGATLGNLRKYVNSAWATESYKMLFALYKYPAAAKTYISPVFDLGAIPSGNSSLTIDTTEPVLAVPNYVFTTNTLYPWHHCASADANTLTWELNASASADMSTPTQVATGQTARDYSISGAANLKRYYQITYTLTSTTGESTPMLVGATIYAPLSTTAPTDINLSEIVGCGSNVYTSIAASPATINTMATTSTRPAAWCTYNNDLFYRTGSSLLRRWDAIASSDSTVAAALKTDGSAGVDPPERAYALVTHNDKLITGGYVGKLIHTGVSTTITEAALTTTATTFTTTTTANGMVGWKIRPDTSWEPEQWSVITSNTDKVATCTGSELVTKGHADLGDTFDVYRYYPKMLQYTTEAEPCDWPTLSLLTFNTADGDMIQQLVSINGNLLVICNEQVWRVAGYGPSTPWEKKLVSKSGGTIAPMSVVSTPYNVYWWSEEGIVKCEGGSSVPTVVDGAIQQITLDTVNATARAQIVGCLHKGRIYWSYPSGTSNVNNKTIVFDETSSKWAQLDFGMYCPVSILDPTTGVTALKFWEPTSGCMCRIDETVYTHGGAVPEFSVTSSFLTPTDPTEYAQYLYLRAVVKANETLAISVYTAKDYTDTYTLAGTLVPIDSATSGRTSVNATDTVYICRFDTSVTGSSISVQLRGSSSTALEILQLQVICDPIEYSTYK